MEQENNKPVEPDVNKDDGGQAIRTQEPKTEQQPEPATPTMREPEEVSSFTQEENENQEVASQEANSADQNKNLPRRKEYPPTADRRMLRPRNTERTISQPEPTPQGNEDVVIPVFSPELLQAKIAQKEAEIQREQNAQKLVMVKQADEQETVAPIKVQEENQVPDRKSEQPVVEKTNVVPPTAQKPIRERQDKVVSAPVTDTADMTVKETRVPQSKPEEKPIPVKEQGKPEIPRQNFRNRENPKTENVTPREPKMPREYNTSAEAKPPREQSAPKEHPIQRAPAQVKPQGQVRENSTQNNSAMNSTQQNPSQGNDLRKRVPVAATPQQNRQQRVSATPNSNRRVVQNDRREQRTEKNSLLSKKISLVVPLFDEEESLQPLTNEIRRALQFSQNYEVIFVDDGSRDNSLKVIKEICKNDSRFKYISFQKNYGKSAALQVGFRHVTGDIVITMDADLQDDPAEVYNLIKKMDEGYDLVSGWKKKRFDPFIKRHSSKFFNFMTRVMSGIKLHDFNCGLKAYRRPVVDTITVYGELHRYMPVLAHWQGFSVTELPVKHHPRKYGKTKFGISRFFKGFVDLLTVVFITRYIKRPMHFFGFFGAGFTFVGFMISLWLSIEKLFQGVPLSNRPLLILGTLMITVGIQFFSIGMIGELIVHSTQNEKEYKIKSKGV